MAEEEHALRIRHAELADNDLTRKDITVSIDFVANPPRLAISSEAAAANFKRPQTLLQALLKGPSDGHRFTDRFHLGIEGRIGLWKLLKGEPWHLGDDIIDGRLEAGGSLTGNVVFDFVEQVADRQFSCDFGYWKPG